MKNQKTTIHKSGKFAVALAFGLTLSLLSGCASSTPPPPPAPPPPPTFDVAAYRKVSVSIEIPGYLPDGLQKESVASAMDSAMQDVLIQKGYTVLERTKLKGIRQEQTLQGSGYTKTTTANFGNALSAPGAFIVTLTNLQRMREWDGTKNIDYYTANLSIKLIDTDKGVTLWSKTARGNSLRTSGVFPLKTTYSVGDGVDTAQYVARLVAQNIPAQP